MTSRIEAICLVTEVSHDLDRPTITPPESTQDSFTQHVQNDKLCLFIYSRAYTAVRWHRSSTVTMTTSVNNIGWSHPVKTVFLISSHSTVTATHTHSLSFSLLSFLLLLLKL